MQLPSLQGAKQFLPLRYPSPHPLYRLAHVTVSTYSLSVCTHTYYNNKNKNNKSQHISQSSSAWQVAGRRCWDGEGGVSDVGQEVTALLLLLRGGNCKRIVVVGEGRGLFDGTKQMTLQMKAGNVAAFAFIRFTHKSH